MGKAILGSLLLVLNWRHTLLACAGIVSVLGVGSAMLLPDVKPLKEAYVSEEDSSVCMRFQMLRASQHKVALFLVCCVAGGLYAIRVFLTLLAPRLLTSLYCRQEPSPCDLAVASRQAAFASMGFSVTGIVSVLTFGIIKDKCSLTIQALAMVACTG
eukprot:Platyproteum_vivax@DN6959_c0_g2_i1.p2